MCAFGGPNDLTMTCQWIILAIFICSAVALEHDDHSPADCTFQGSHCQWENGDQSGLRWQHGSLSDFERSRLYSLKAPPAGPNSQFMFIQTHPDSDARKKWVSLSSPTLTIDGERCLIFDYFNNLDNTVENKVSYGSLRLYIQYYNKTEVLLAHFRRSVIKSWFRAEISLPLGEYMLVFKSFYDGDANTAAAVDDIGLFNTRCGEVVIDRVIGDCGFDAGLCGYTQQGERPFLTYRKEELFSGEGSTYSPTGNFLGATRAEYYNYALGLMQLKLPTLNIVTESCLYFNRHNSVGVPDNQLAEYNALNVKGTGPQGNYTEYIPKIFSDHWYSFLLFLKPGQHSIILEAKASNKFGRDDYVGIDAVEVLPQTCNETIQNMESLRGKAFACEAYKDRGLCENGGTCISRGIKIYKCACPEGYYGDRCQWLSPCHDNPCVHGNCALVGRKQYHCKCDEGFYNKYCNATAVCISPPPEIDNGKIISISNMSYWGVTIYKCNEGFFMVGLNKSVCRQGWNNPPTCKPIVCGPVPTIANGYFANDSITQPGFSVLPTVAPHLPTLNSTVTVHCNESFEYKNGDRVLRCGENSIWVGNVGQCVRKQECGTPPQVHNGQLISLTTKDVGGLVSYECNTGYLQIGIGEAHCMRDLQWHFLPQCISHCSVKSGQSGSHESVAVEITECSTTNIHITYPTKESCSDPVKHVIRKGDFNLSDNIRFYGEEVCFSVQTTKTTSSRSATMYTTLDLPDEVKCETFCLPFKEGAKRVISKERIRYESELYINRNTIAFVTKGTGEN